jgi:hypothetical protein
LRPGGWSLRPRPCGHKWMIRLMMETACQPSANKLYISLSYSLISLFVTLKLWKYEIMIFPAIVLWWKF